MTATNMIAMGVSMREDLIITPDWALISIFIALIIIVLIVLIAGLYQFQNTTWGKVLTHSLSYKAEALNNNADLWNFSSKGSVLHVDNVSNGLRNINEIDNPKNNKQHDQNIVVRKK